MALHLTDRNVAHEIAERIRTLIARNDHGDITAAARRLDRPIADVYLPERLMCSGNEPAAIDFLATVVRTYEADACWLITGSSSRNSRNRRPISREARGTIVELLDQLSERLLDEVRNETPHRSASLRADVSRVGNDPHDPPNPRHPHHPSS